jgi:hypothetical protein
MAHGRAMGLLFDQLEPFGKAFVRAVLRIRRDSEADQESVDAAAATLSAYVDSIDHLPSDGPQDEAWFARYTAGVGAELIAFLFTQFGIADLRLVTERHLAAVQRWRMTGKLPASR